MIHGNFFPFWLSWSDNIPGLRIVHYSKVPHCPGVLQTQAANSVVRSMSCPLLANQMDKSVQFHFQALLAACRALLIGLWCGSACQVVCLNLHRNRLQDLQQEVSQYQIPATRARARCVSLWLDKELPLFLPMRNSVWYASRHFLHRKHCNELRIQKC